MVGKKIEMPNSDSSLKINNEEKNTVRLFGEAGERVNRSDVVVLTDVDVNSLSPEGLARYVEEQVLSNSIAGCPHCGQMRDVDRLRSYGYAGVICEDCWENCPNCGQCDEWKHESHRSTRKSNKKKCDNCGHKLVTQVATG